MGQSRVIPPPQASARNTDMGEAFNRVLFSALDALEERNIPFALIGGIAASSLGRPRSTHDIDIFVRPEDAEATLEGLARHGFETDRTDERWLFKGWKEEMMVDIIFKSEGDIYFDDEMHERAQLLTYHGRQVPTVSPEDLIIIKCAVHSEIGPHHWHDALAVLSHANMDWQYLLKRARRAPRRLLALLIYAQSNDIWIPNSVIGSLFQTVFADMSKPAETSETAKNPPKGAEIGPTTRQQVNTAGARPAKTSELQQIADDLKKPSPQPHFLKDIQDQPEAYIAGQLRDAIASDDRTAASDVKVVVHGRRVVVKGELQNEAQRRAIEDVVQGLASGFEVDNQVRIPDLRPPDGAEVVV